MVIRKRREKYYYCFLLFFILCNFQNLTLLPAESFDFDVKACHVISFLFLLPLLRQRKLVFPPKIIMAFMLLFVLVSVLACGYGFSLSSHFIVYMWGLYICMIVMNVGKNISRESWVKMLQTMAIFVMTAVIIKNIVEFDKILSFLRNPYGHPLVSTFIQGGVNIESSWLAIYGFVFGKTISKKGIIYNLLSISISAIYASRCGILINFMWVMWIVIANRNKFKINNILIVFLGAAVLIAVGARFGIFDYVWSRFVKIGNEAGSLGRLRIWQGMAETVKKYPFGCGIGNSMKALAQATSLYYSAGNMHNVFLQMFVDLGIVGGIFYLLLVGGFYLKEFRFIFEDYFIIMLMVYFLISILQFRGGDSLMAIILGIYFLLKEREKESYGAA